MPNASHFLVNLIEKYWFESGYDSKVSLKVYNVYFSINTVTVLSFKPTSNHVNCKESVQNLRQPAIRDIKNKISYSVTLFPGQAKFILINNSDSITDIFTTATAMNWRLSVWLQTGTRIDSRIFQLFCCCFLFVCLFVVLFYFFYLNWLCVDIFQSFQG